MNPSAYKEMIEFVLDIANRGRGSAQHRMRAMEIVDKYGLKDKQLITEPKDE